MGMASSLLPPVHIAITGSIAVVHPVAARATRLTVFIVISVKRVDGPTRANFLSSLTATKYFCEPKAIVCFGPAHVVVSSAKDEAAQIAGKAATKHATMICHLVWAMLFLSGITPSSHSPQILAVLRQSSAGRILRLFGVLTRRIC